MKLIDWIAILGALAWTPHVVVYLKNKFTKPEVRIITNKYGEIGFTTFGNIFNIRLAFSVKYHDIVISDLKVRIVHEGGDEKIFDWQRMRQQISTVTTPDGGIMPNEKMHSVLAIKLNQNEIEEKDIQCQEVTFINEIYKLDAVAVKKSTYLKEQEKFDSSEFLKSSEMSDIYRYINQSFSWKIGNYEIIIELESPEKFNLKDNKYSFELSSLDIENLDKNKKQIEPSYEPHSEDKPNEVTWNWCNPLLIKK